MPDVVDAATRSRMMSGIRGKNTKPEIILRQRLHGLGFRFRLHVKELPGKPDLVLPKHRAAVFVHGCFWHRHECKIFKWPQTRQEFWRAKLNGNADRDAQHIQKLLEENWRCAIVWECALRSASNLEIEKLASDLALWLKMPPASEPRLLVFP
jgi:DNA mismatch endonuclease (patch repair protein)